MHSLTPIARPSKNKLSGFEWLAIITLFLVVGTLGHDPWKQDETYSFGIIYHYLTAHTWLIPMNAGVPFMEKPPLYYWTAAIFCKLLGGVLPLHDAARLASVFYMGVTCLSVWAMSQIIFNDHNNKTVMGRITLALLLSCFGLVRHAHDMFTDVALLAGTSVAMWGMAMAICNPTKWLNAGLLIGVGIGMAFLSKGLLVPMILCISGVGLLLFSPQLRMRRTYITVLIALLAASPFVCIWPVLLYQQSPDLLKEWLWENNIGRFLGFSVQKLGAANDKSYMFSAVLWFAFPVFPLAIATLYMQRKKWRMPEYILPATISVVGLALLLSSASARALYLLPLLPPFAVLGTQALVRVPALGLTLYTSIIRILASIAAIIIFVVWICLLHPDGPQPFARLYGEWLPLGFIPQQSQWIAILCSVAMTGFWCASFRLSPRNASNTAIIGLLAVALPWCMAMSLLLPWIDETRSFRPVLTELTQTIDSSIYSNGCVARYHLGESVSPMWEYFGKGRGLGPLEDFNGTHCPLLLLMTGKSMPPISDSRWHVIWKGSRRFDSKDELELYERNTGS